MKTKKILKIISIVLLVMLIFIILGATFYVFSCINGLKLDKNAIESKYFETTKIEDENGKLINNFSTPNEFVPYEEINKTTIDAFISVEDKRFFEHAGLDFRRIVGATINNLKAGSLKEGGSTITQQLIKNKMLSQEKTIERKITEAKLSIDAEKEYTKEEILTYYLNGIYFGNSFYGINAVSLGLFNKKPINLTLSESAIIAGIVKNPLRYSPLNSLENAVKRRNLVLSLMLEQKRITITQYNNAVNEEILLYARNETRSNGNDYKSYIDLVTYEASQILGIDEKNLTYGGYKIITYFNKNEQKTVEMAYESNDLQVKNSEKTILLVNNRNNSITAYKSSVGYSPFVYRRSPASTIKPLCSYAPAFESNLVMPHSPILDEKITVNGYSPKNYNNQYLGWTTVKDSLAQSSNACSLKLMNEVGKPYAFATLEKFGIKLAPQDGLAVALGGTTFGVTPIEITRAYACIANEGKIGSLSTVKAIYDKNGKALYERKPDEKQIISKETAYFLTHSMMETVKTGTAKKLHSLPFQIASKTGTNGDSKGNYDAWNISYTTNHTLSVWYGSKDYNVTMPLEISGGSYPTLVARYVFSNLPHATNFHLPSGVNYAEIDTYTLKNQHLLQLASKDTPLEYKKVILIKDDFSLDESNYFSDALPKDFAVSLGDGECFITFSKSQKFNLVLTSLNGNVISKHEKGSGKVELILPKPTFGINVYFLKAYTEDNVLVETSPPQTIFSQ